MGSKPIATPPSHPAINSQVGALANIATYWFLAIPLAHHLAFARGWGLHGLWTGALAANAVQTCLMLGISLMFDYAGEARKAAARFALVRPRTGPPPCIHPHGVEQNVITGNRTRD